MPEGRVVFVNDSVKLEPELAPTLLQGLALSNDMTKVPEDLQPSLVHASAYIVQAGQAILRATQKAELAAAERACIYEDLKAEREKVRSYKGSLKTAKTQITELERENDEMTEKLKDTEKVAEKLKKAERELGQVLRKEKRKMKEADEKGYQAGFDRAGAEYVREARSMVNGEIKMRVPVAYCTGYKDGVKAACEVLNLEADMNMYKSIPAPVTPELVLPYTDEECLPPEEFPESEDDVDDLTDAGGGSGGMNAKDGAGKVVEDAEQEPVNVSKDTEDVAEKGTENLADKGAEIAADATAEDVPHV